MSITNAARRFEQRFDAKAERFIWHHPLLGFISIFVGMPVGTKNHFFPYTETQFFEFDKYLFANWHRDWTIPTL